jgi:hypothetical protein
VDGARSLAQAAGDLRDRERLPVALLHQVAIVLGHLLHAVTQCDAAAFQLRLQRLVAAGGRSISSSSKTDPAPRGVAASVQDLIARDPQRPAREGAVGPVGLELLPEHHGDVLEHVLRAADFLDMGQDEAPQEPLDRDQAADELVVREGRLDSHRFHPNGYLPTPLKTHTIFREILLPMRNLGVEIPYD